MVLRTHARARGCDVRLFNEWHCFSERGQLAFSACSTRWASAARARLGRAHSAAAARPGRRGGASCRGNSGKPDRAWVGLTRSKMCQHDLTTAPDDKDPPALCPRAKRCPI